MAKEVQVCLATKVKGLERVAVGQAAMIALLASMLVKKNVLSPLEARMIVMAGTDAQSYEGLEPDAIVKWAADNLKENLRGLGAQTKRKK